MNYRSQKIYELAKKYRVDREEGKTISQDHWLKECFSYNDKLVYCQHGGSLDEKAIIISTQYEAEGHIEVVNEDAHTEYRLVYFHPIKKCIVQEELGEKKNLLEKFFAQNGMKRGMDISFFDGKIRFERSNLFLNKLYFIDSNNIKHTISDNVVCSIKIDEKTILYQRVEDIYGEEDWRFTGITVSMNGVVSSIYKADIEIDDGKVTYLFIDEKNDKRVMIFNDDFSVNLISKREGEMNYLYNKELEKE